MGACTLTPGNYCARLMNSIIRLGVSMSLAPFVCWERDGIALGGIDGGGGGWRGEERQREGRGSGREKTMRRATTRMGRQGGRKMVKEK